MIEIPVSWGELVDKITILEIKCERIDDPSKIRNVRRELDLLAARLGSHADVPELGERVDALRSVNRALWDIEDEIRLCEDAGDFGARFIELARAVYVTNDRRAALKREINILLQSDIIEEKSYQSYKRR